MQTFGRKQAGDGYSSANPLHRIWQLSRQDTRSSPEYTQILIQPKGTDFIQLGHLETSFNHCGLAPIQDPLLFWFMCGHVKRQGRQ